MSVDETKENAYEDDPKFKFSWIKDTSLTANSYSTTTTNSNLVPSTYRGDEISYMPPSTPKGKSLLIYPDDADGVQCFPGDIVTPIDGMSAGELYKVVAIVDENQIYIQYTEGFGDNEARPYTVDAKSFKHCKYPELQEVVRSIVEDIIGISGFDETYTSKVTDAEKRSIVKFATSRLADYLNDKYKLDI